MVKKNNFFTIIPIIILYTLLYYSTAYNARLFLLIIFTAVYTAFINRKLIPALFFLFTIFSTTIIGNIYDIKTLQSLTDINLLSQDFYIWLLIFFIIAGSVFKGSYMRCEKTSIEKFEAIFLMILILSTLRGALIRTVERPFEGFYYISIIVSYFIILYFIFNIVRTVDTIKKNIRIMYLIILATGMLACAGLINGNKFLNLLPAFYTSDSPSDIKAVYLFYPFLFGSIAMIFTKKIIEKIFYFLSFIIYFFCVVYTYYVYCFISIFYILILLACILFFTRNFKKTVFLFVIIFLYIIFIHSVMTSDMKKSIENIFKGKNEIYLPTITGELKKINIDDKSFSKVDDLRNKIANFKEYPVLGLGLTSIENINNTFIDILTQSGIAGIISLALIIIILFIKAFTLEKYYRLRDQFISSFLYSYIFMLISFVALSFWFNTIFSIEIMSIMIIMTAFLLRLEAISKLDSEYYSKAYAKCGCGFYFKKIDFSNNPCPHCGDEMLQSPNNFRDVFHNFIMRCKNFNKLPIKIFIISSIIIFIIIYAILYFNGKSLLNLYRTEKRIDINFSVPPFNEADKEIPDAYKNYINEQMNMILVRNNYRLFKNIIYTLQLAKENASESEILDIIKTLFKRIENSVSILYKNNSSFQENKFLINSFAIQIKSHIISSEPVKAGRIIDEFVKLVFIEISSELLIRHNGYADYLQNNISVSSTKYEYLKNEIERISENDSIHIEIKNALIDSLKSKFSENYQKIILLQRLITYKPIIKPNAQIVNHTCNETRIFPNYKQTFIAAFFLSIMIGGALTVIIKKIGG